VACRLIALPKILDWIAVIMANPLPCDTVVSILNTNAEKQLSSATSVYLTLWWKTEQHLNID